MLFSFKLTALINKKPIIHSEKMISGLGDLLSIIDIGCGLSLASSRLVCILGKFRTWVLSAFKSSVIKAPLPVFSKLAVSFLSGQL